MPVGEEFWNPYRLIPMPKGQPPRKEPQYHHRPRGSSGTLWCRLEAKTALLVSKQEGTVNTFWKSKRTNKPTIPGTSLMGMLRSVVEIVGHGCAITSRSDACQSIGGLCVACRMFGWVGQGQRDALYRGHVNIGDGEMDSTPTPEARWQKADVYLSRPRPTHASFYPGPKSAYRKLYHHQPHCKQDPAPPLRGVRANTSLKPAPAGTIFTFQVRFRDLPDKLLGLLLYALVLEEECQATLTGWDEEIGQKRKFEIRGPLCHKLGQGKPLGLGSCKVEIEKARFSAGLSRYAPEGLAKARKILEGDELDNWIRGKTEPYRGLETKTMQAFRKMTIFDADDPRKFRYPSLNWFSANPNRKLKPL